MHTLLPLTSARPERTRRKRFAAVLAAAAIATAGVLGVSAPASAATTLSIKAGSTKVVPIGGSGTVGSASATYTLPKLPASGSGLYASVRVRSNTSGAYVLQSRVYPTGQVQVSLKKSTRANGAEKLTLLGTTKVAPAKASAGSPIAMKLNVDGSKTTTLSGTVTVAGKTQAVSFSDSTSPLTAAGTADATFFVSSSTPALSVNVGSTASSLSNPSAPAPTTPAPAPTTPAPVPTTPAPVSSSADRNASNTGVPKDVTLKVHNGDITINEPNTVIDGLEVRGIITINAPGAVIKNSKIVGTGTARSVGLVNNIVSGASFTVIDSEIAAATEDTLWNGIFGSNFTAIRVNVHRVVDPIRILGSNVTVEDSWLHDTTYWEKDPQRNGTPTHDDTVQIQAGENIRLEGNRMEDAHNAAIMIGQDRSRTTMRNIVVKDNYMQGGACTVNIDYTPTVIKPQLIDNVFGPERTSKPCAVITPHANAPEFSGNIWEATGLPMNTYIVAP